MDTDSVRKRDNCKLKTRFGKTVSGFGENGPLFCHTLCQFSLMAKTSAACCSCRRIAQITLIYCAGMLRCIVK